MLAVIVVVATAIAVPIMVPSTMIVESIPIVVMVMPITAVSVVIVSVVEMAAIIVAARSVVAVIPRASADEHAVHKIIRSVIAIGGAGIRRISVITVSADGRWSRVTIRWANPNVDDNSLCMSIRSEKQANAQETQKP